MGLEVVLAAAVGLMALWMVLQPLARPHSIQGSPDEPLDPEETPKGVALTALKEIEFDRETGKLSDADYEQLKQRYTAAAVQALRAETKPGASDDVEAMIAGRVRSLRSARSGTRVAA
jgi:methionine-rich copper-binding protein CopC